MPRRGEPSERTCIVTRRTEPVAKLVRFVIAPDGNVVPDLRRRLPGRGVWVTARAEHIRTAERRKLFARGFGVPVKVEPDLAGRVGDQLTASALGALSLARKAGSVVVGFAKVEEALTREPVLALIHAADAGSDGVAKLAAAARRRFGENSDLRVIRLFTGEQLDLAFGRPNVIHAALLVGPASSNMLARVNALVDYFVEDARAGRDNRTLTETNQLSPGLKSA